MREERVIALAGVFQACALVRSVAVRGNADSSAMRISTSSIFKIDADSAADVFGGIGGIRLGLETLVAQLGDSARDLVLTRVFINVLRLERALSARPKTLQALRDGIDAIAAQMPQTSTEPESAAARLAQLYVDALSPLRPRIVVEGNPLYLTQSAQVDRIRTALLAAVRAAVLWRQLGGTRWRLVFRYRQYAMLARGLLSRCTIDGS